MYGHHPTVFFSPDVAAPPPSYDNSNDDENAPQQQQQEPPLNSPLKPSVFGRARRKVVGRKPFSPLSPSQMNVRRPSVAPKTPKTPGWLDESAAGEMLTLTPSKTDPTSALKGLMAELKAKMQTPRTLIRTVIKAGTPTDDDENDKENHGTDFLSPTTAAMPAPPPPTPQTPAPRAAMADRFTKLVESTPRTLLRGVIRSAEESNQVSPGLPDSARVSAATGARTVATTGTNTDDSALMGVDELWSTTTRASDKTWVGPTGLRFLGLVGVLVSLLWGLDMYAASQIVSTGAYYHTS